MTTLKTSKLKVHHVQTLQFVGNMNLDGAGEEKTASTNILVDAGIWCLEDNAGLDSSADSTTPRCASTVSQTGFA